jgi:hypothetical protein
MENRVVTVTSDPFKNPFKPGAGQMPPYLAGRQKEAEEFRQLLGQDIILQNMILTGLRGVGKTVLLETFKPLAIKRNWLWVNTDLSESASVSESTLATRILADLALVTAGVTIDDPTVMGFTRGTPQKLSYQTLAMLFNDRPGLGADKLKYVLEFVWQELVKEINDIKGIVFAYDEAQNLADHAQKGQYPLSMLLDVFQAIQRKDIPFMLALTGLPTLQPKLVEARTYSERMFHVVFLEKLTETESREAVLVPVLVSGCPVVFSESTVAAIIEMSAGYPFFIQFICREVYDVWIQKITLGEEPSVPASEISHKLDADFFAGRWAKATDRQRDLLKVIAGLPNCDSEFTLREIIAASKTKKGKPFTSSHVNQMLVSLSKAGLAYKNRHGKYSFAVPLLGQFIRRQEQALTPSI